MAAAGVVAFEFVIDFAGVPSFSSDNMPDRGRAVHRNFDIMESEYGGCFIRFWKGARLGIHGGASVAEIPVAGLSNGAGLFVMAARRLYHDVGISFSLR